MNMLDINAGIPHIFLTSLSYVYCVVVMYKQVCACIYLIFYEHFNLRCGKIISNVYLKFIYLK